MLGFLRQVLRAVFGRENRFLCDTCRYDHGNACTRPERPNATKCPDYRRGAR